VRQSQVEFEMTEFRVKNYSVGKFFFWRSQLLLFYYTQLQAGGNFQKGTEKREGEKHERMKQ
jgi:hypothetical protein